MSKKEVKDFIVIENRALNDTNFFIKLKTESGLPELKPGQFVNIDIPGTSEIFLRRPFSIFEVNYSENTIAIIVKILGRGSKKLTEIRVGAICNIVFPLGNGFTIPKSDERVLLIGGGSGVAPMLFLAKVSGSEPENVNLLLGARSKNDHVNVEHYSEYGILHYTTEDGSKGEKGFVTQHSVFKNNLSSFDRIYACGPDAMMKAVAKEAKAAGVFCEVSLENLMACGIGVCLCCIEPTTHGNKCVCSDGPVFNINELKW
jgi:dihydroorotate dehydrogenase electron transfer subunit